MISLYTESLKKKFKLVVTESNKVEWQLPEVSEGRRKGEILIKTYKMNNFWWPNMQHDDYS